jgi:Tol biopolymer transport system component
MFRDVGLHNYVTEQVEDHTDDRPAAVRNFIGAISLSDPVDGCLPAVSCLVQGADFYASPQVSPDGTRLAWVSWNHPNLPWDSTSLTVGTIAVDGAVVSEQVVAGGPEDPPQSVMAPRFSPLDQKLAFITDTSGWWSLWRCGD